jgi:peptidoglycan/LPS O-acetylase OafA/YrhL
LTEPHPAAGTHARQIQKRLDHLDALRGLAALAVVAYHYILFFGFPGKLAWVMTNTPLHFWWDGHAAVTFFFVLSGLVLSYRHFRTSPHPTLHDFNYVGFAVQRYCRIWLPYVAIMLISAALFRFSAKYTLTNPPIQQLMLDLWREAPTLRHVIRQIIDSRILGPGNYQQTLVPQGWTLTLELSVALLIPLGVLVAARSLFWLIAGVLIGCVAAYVNPYFFHFALGIALARIYVPAVAWLEARRAVRVAVALLAWPLYDFEFVFPHLPHLHNFDTLNLWISALGAALIILTVSSTPPIRRFLTRGLIHFIGKVSFSIYLVHILIMMILIPRVVARLGMHSPQLAWQVGLITTLVTSIVAAWPLFRLVEMPAMAIGKSLAKWIDARLPAGAFGRFIARPFARSTVASNQTND